MVLLIYSSLVGSVMSQFGHQVLQYFSWVNTNKYLFMKYGPVADQRNDSVQVYLGELMSLIRLPAGWVSGYL